MSYLLRNMVADGLRAIPGVTVDPIEDPMVGDTLTLYVDTDEPVCATCAVPICGPNVLAALYVASPCVARENVTSGYISCSDEPCPEIPCLCVTEELGYVTGQSDHDLAYEIVAGVRTARLRASAATT